MLFFLTFSSRRLTQPITELYGAKYPLMSKNTSDGSDTNTLIPLFGPAGTNAAFAVINPSQAFNVETTGCAVPAGHVLNHPKYLVVGTAVIFTEYAEAVVGIPHELGGNGNVRVAPAPSDGGPNAPVIPANARVSATRQGVTG